MGIDPLGDPTVNLMKAFSQWHRGRSSNHANGDESEFLAGLTLEDANAASR